MHSVFKTVRFASTNLAKLLLLSYNCTLLLLMFPALQGGFVACIRVIVFTVSMFFLYCFNVCLSALSVSVCLFLFVFMMFMALLA